MDRRQDGKKPAAQLGGRKKAAASPTGVRNAAGAHGYLLRTNAGPVTNAAMSARLVAQQVGEGDSDHATVEAAKAAFEAAPIDAGEWANVWLLAAGQEPLLLWEGYRSGGNAVEWTERGTEPSLLERVSRSLKRASKPEEPAPKRARRGDPPA